jgi:2-methylisocitrate lyase-like PEP mutase family enzyme
VFLSGSAVAASQLGRPDIGLVTLTEMAQALDRIRDRVSIPVVVDADSGFGNEFHVGRSVRALERAGASGIQIEDQVNTKAMSDIANRPVVATDVMVGKIKAALDGRTSAETIISARSDAFYTEGAQSAIARAVTYAEAGADMVFVPGLESGTERHDLCHALKDRVPLLYNMMNPDAPGAPSVADLQADGFSIVLFPGAVIGPSANAGWQALSALAGNKVSPDPVGIGALIDAEAYLKS